MTNVRVILIFLLSKHLVSGTVAHNSVELISLAQNSFASEKLLVILHTCNMIHYRYLDAFFQHHIFIKFYHAKSYLTNGCFFNQVVWLCSTIKRCLDQISAEYISFWSIKLIFFLGKLYSASMPASVPVHSSAFIENRGQKSFTKPIFHKN